MGMQVKGHPSHRTVMHRPHTTPKTWTDNNETEVHMWCSRVHSPLQYRTEKGRGESRHRVDFYKVIDRKRRTQGGGGRRAPERGPFPLSYFPMMQQKPTHNIYEYLQQDIRSGGPYHVPLFLFCASFLLDCFLSAACWSAVDLSHFRFGSTCMLLDDHFRDPS